MRYLHIFILLISTIVLVSCEDFLVAPSPSELTESQFWNTSSDAEQGLAAVYDAAQSAFEVDYYRWGELRGDNMIKGDRPSSNDVQILDNELAITTAGNDWGAIYSAIATANLAIERIPEIDAFSGQENLLAEAHALRALFYFYAVRVWGDVPKITDPITSLEEASDITRSPASEIMNDIILPDLETAEELIVTQRNLHRISLGSILALKAHIYMWPGGHQDYEIARDAITQLEGMGYGLETTQDGWISNIFRESQTSNEIIFSLEWNFNTDGNNGGITQYIGFSPTIYPSEELYDKWMAVIPGDFRALATAAFDVEIVDYNEFPYTRALTKYSGAFSDRSNQGNWASSNDVNILFYRFTGLLLLKAEAENNLDNPAEALTLLNRVRSARGLPLADESITDPVVIRDLILDERQFELMGEGHRFWDLVRNEVAMDVLGIADVRKILWPVSQNVMNRNPQIEQTDGYN